MFPVLEMVDLVLTRKESVSACREALDNVGERFTDPIDPSVCSYVVVNKQEGIHAPRIDGTKDSDQYGALMADGSLHSGTYILAEKEDPGPSGEPQISRDEHEGEEEDEGTESERAAVLHSHRQGPTPCREKVLYYGSRVVIVGLASAIAILVPQFEYLMSLVGSLGASFLAFIAPGVLALRVLREPDQRSPPLLDAILYILLIVFGLVGGIIGTIASLSGLATHQDQC